jgi:hypothetical protein
LFLTTSRSPPPLLLFENPFGSYDNIHITRGLN